MLSIRCMSLAVDVLGSATTSASVRRIPARSSARRRYSSRRAASITLSARGAPSMLSATEHLTLRQRPGGTTLAGRSVLRCSDAIPPGRPPGWVQIPACRGSAKRAPYVSAPTIFDFATSPLPGDGGRLPARAPKGRAVRSLREQPSRLRDRLRRRTPPSRKTAPERARRAPDAAALRVRQPAIRPQRIGSRLVVPGHFASPHRSRPRPLSSAILRAYVLEVRTGFEPAWYGFANRCLATRRTSPEVARRNAASAGACQRVPAR
jgi:hypothetical protein